MKIGSLFSGYGGLDLAVEAIFNAQPAWFCEFDKAPSKVLAHHWPDVPNHKDVTQINWKEVEPVDILTGGSPCQDLSHAGKRAGMTEGTRSNLWVNMREAIATLQPKYVVWENVLGALSAKATSDSDVEPGEGLLANAGDGHLRALGRVLGDLTEIGYNARWTTIRASDIGAPHHRARVFLIAWPATTNPRSLRQHRRRTTPRQARRPHTTAHRRRPGPVDHWDAIEHWAKLTRPAPEPTLVGRRGGVQLNPAFAEWMMGLPEGWVTDPDIGLTHSQQLKALGNGVVPPQAAYALQHLLTN